MRKISAANRVASSPPVPARISSTTFFSSFGSLGSSRTLICSSILRFSGSRSATSCWAMALSSASASCSMGRACWRLSSTFFHSRYLATASSISLRPLAILRYSAPSPITAGSAIWLVSSSKRFSSCSSFGTNCMIYYKCQSGPVNLGDHQLSALGLFKRHSAFKGADGHRRLVVGRRLGGNALQPQSRGRHRSQHRTAPLGREADQFITHARDHRQQHDSRKQLCQETIERDASVEDDGNDQHDEQEAGAAARVERGKTLCV